MKNHFHLKGWALNLILIQRPGGTRKWPIVLPPPPRPPPPNNIYTPTMDTLCARDFSCTVSSFSQVFIVNHAKSFFLRLCSLWLQPSTEESVSLEPTCKKKPLVPRAIMEGLLYWNPPPPPSPNNSTITPLKIPHWVMLTLNNTELKQRHFWETHVNRKWGIFPWLCLQVLPNVYCYRAVVKCRGRGFPLATMNVAVATFIEKQKKNKTKRNP